MMPEIAVWTSRGMLTMKNQKMVAETMTQICRRSGKKLLLLALAATLVVGATTGATATIGYGELKTLGAESRYEEIKMLNGMKDNVLSVGFVLLIP